MNQLLTQMELAKAVEDLNKFVHFDFPRSLKYYGENTVSLLSLLDQNNCFQAPFSKWFRHLSEMEMSLGRAQSGVNRLQFAAARNEPYPQLKKASERIYRDLEQVKENAKELGWLISGK